jgi:hypothetical protein
MTTLLFRLVIWYIKIYVIYLYNHLIFYFYSYFESYFTAYNTIFDFKMCTLRIFLFHFFYFIFLKILFIPFHDGADDGA